MLPRVPPFRGAQVATGVVVLTTLAVLLELRMRWAPGGHLAATGGLALLVWALVLGTPPAEGRARPWLAALCLSAVGLLGVAGGHLVDVLGGDGFYGVDGPHQARDTVFGALLVGVAAAWCSRRRAAASCALLAGLAGVVAVVELAEWVGSPSMETFRWLLLGCAVVLLLCTLASRDRRPLHAAQYANAGGIAVAAIGVRALVLGFFEGFSEDVDGGAGILHLGTGWELVLLAAGFGLLAYGAVDGQRGPVVVGLVDLGLFVVAATVPEGSFWGWPVFLAAAGLVFLVIGLRPTTPAPPEPLYGDPPPPIEVRPLR